MRKFFYLRLSGEFLVVFGQGYSMEILICPSRLEIAQIYDFMDNAPFLKDHYKERRGILEMEEELKIIEMEK